VIVALNLRWQTLGRGILADGGVSSFDVYQAKVVWDGSVRRVFVDARHPSFFLDSSEGRRYGHFRFLLFSFPE
jgi:hypothetical protein